MIPDLQPSTLVDQAKLLEIRETLASTLLSFPAGCCMLTAIAVEKRVGYEFIEGLFIDDNNVGHPHCWNLDTQSGEYVDLTASQFNPAIAPVFRVRPESEEGRLRYIEGPTIAY